jgi:hypothetical protein
VKGRLNRDELGLGRSAQAGRPSLVPASVRPPFPCTQRIFNPKTLEAPPFGRGESHSHQEAIHKLEREEGDQPPQRKHPQVEKKEDTIGRVTMINGAMSSTLMG